MNRSVGYHFLRLGLAITFVWVGIFILRDPAGWGGFIKPWAREFLPADLVGFMRANGIFNIAVGSLLGLGIWVRLVSILAVLHLVGGLVASGIDAVTVRDIGLLGGALALAFWPVGRGRWGRRENNAEYEK